jgi:hypothetical protein
MATDPKVIAIAMAIKQSLELNAGPGSSINAHPNAFFLNVNGAVDLYRAAERALAAADRYVESVKIRFEAEVKLVFEKIQTELANGAVSIEDALARIKAKAGGELLASEGALDSAIERVQSML